MLKEVKRICLWSGPRNVSTALMYAFAQRPDTRVIDEPLYAHYLRISGANHPGREEILAAMEPQGERVVSDVILGQCDRPVFFMKQMAHHLVELDLAFLSKTTNLLLIRDPEQMLPSLANQLPSPTLRDTGLRRQSELYDDLVSRDQSPVILDARLTLLDPEGVLRILCNRLGIPSDKRMLSWNPEPRPEDGVWAKHWYHNVQKSSGFEPYREKTASFPQKLEPLLDKCRPHYERLVQLAIRTKELA